jgi:hypothetical protein
MPNWVFNHLNIEGDDEQVQKVKAQLNAPYTRNYEDEGKVSFTNPVFAFWNIIRPPADKLEEYEGVHGYANGGTQGDTEYNWYNFNNREWGTKWDVGISDKMKYSETSLEDDDEGHLRYRFDTAWSPPLPAIAKLATQYPDLTITISYEEEQGWGGEIVFQGEESTITEEYDIPNSHADYVARDIEDSCNCANEEDQEYWYDDCPNKNKIIELYAVRNVQLAKTE